MGNFSSKKHQKVPESDSILVNHLKNSDYNGQKSEDLITRLDRQTIQTVQKDLSENPELFVLNNMIMAVMFFENYTQYKEDLKKLRLEKPEGYIAPDVILEKVSENVLYRPHHGPNKDHSEPVVPKRLYVFNDWVRVLGTIDEVGESDERTTARLEQCTKKGYIRLRAINNTFKLDSGSPILRIDSIESQSRSSDSSDTSYYAALEDLKTPKPIDIIEGLERHERASQTSLPESCVSYRKIKKLSWDPNELVGGEISEDDLYDTVAYINSKSFMKHLDNDLFLSRTAEKLGFELDDYPPNSKQEKIFCMIKEGERSIPCEIIPCIPTNWPFEETLKFVLKANRAPENRKRYVFPAKFMIDDITSLGCSLLPKGHLKKKGDRKDADIEWELSFPQAQRYLESFMSHAQIKSLIILLTLHKTYVEPKTMHFGLLPEHIRNFILWECESNFSDWPEHRLGIKLLQVIKNLADYLCKPRPNIPNFFVTESNTLSEVDIRKLRVAHKYFDAILKAPLMSFIKALRNLRYTNGVTFFPPFDFKKLCDIMVKPGTEYDKSHLVTTPKRVKIDDMDNIFLRFEESKKRQAAMKKKHEKEQRKNEANLNNKEERRGSVDSIDLNWNCEKTFSIQKKRVILKFFIETFIEISEKSLRISSKYNSLIYIKQAYYLSIILKGECPAFTDDAQEYLEKISSLEKQCNTGTDKVVGTPTREISKTQVPLNGVNKHTKNVQNQPRKSVVFVDVPKETT